MISTRYGQYIKTLTFQDSGLGFFRQGAELNGDLLGQNAHIKLGTYWSAGKTGRAPFVPHVHDCNQVLIWLGADASDPGDLGAEVEICLGEEREKQVITTASAVFLPAGFPHSPIVIARMDKRFLHIEVSCAAELKSTYLPASGQPVEELPYAGWGARYRNHISHLAFERKGAWHYGPANRDDSGGWLTIIRGNQGFDFLMLCETIKKAPYRFGPDPDEPHTHPHPEILLFLGMDTADLSQLGGEAEICLGHEKERYLIYKPSAVVVPGGLAHCPLTITSVKKPFILADVRPFGHGGTSR